MADEIDYITVNIIFDKLMPLIKAHGNDPSRVQHFAFNLLLIAAAMSDEVGISQEEFRALSASAFEVGRNPLTHVSPKKN